MFKAAISKYMAHRKEKKLEKQRSRDAPVVPHGKQTVKQLVGQNQGISNIEITDPSIKEFEKIALYQVNSALKSIAAYNDNILIGWTGNNFIKIPAGRDAIYRVRIEKG